MNDRSKSPNLIKELVSKVLAERHKLDNEDAANLRRGVQRRFRPLNVRVTDHAYDRVFDRFRSRQGVVDFYPILETLDKLKEKGKFDKMVSLLGQDTKVAIVNKQDNVQIVIAPTEEGGASVVTVGRFGDKFRKDVLSGKSTKLVLEGEEIEFDEIIEV